MRLLALLAGLAACRGADSDPPKPPVEPPGPKNLLMITVDTLRRDHISRHDPAGRDLTPFLASLMAEGLVADDHASCANWTFPATACALSGQGALDLGRLPKLELANTAPWSPEIAFLPDLLEPEGFHTAFLGANGWLTQQLGLTDGYDRATLDGARDGLGMYLAGAEQIAALPEDTRWFLHLHWMEPHPAYLPPDEYRVGEDALPPLPWDIDTQPGQYDITVDLWPTMTPDEQALLRAHLDVRYQGEVRWVDAQLRDVFDDLEARGWHDDTIVVIWSDHGEQFWEHGDQAHAYNLFPEETGAVFVAWAADGLPPRAVTAPTTHADVVPTTLELLGLDVPEGLAGQSLLGELDPMRPRFTATRARLGPIQAVERNGKLLTYDWDGRATYHDLGIDPTAQDDRFDAASPDVQALWGLLAPQVQAAIPLVDDASPVPVDGLAW